MPHIESFFSAFSQKKWKSSRVCVFFFFFKLKHKEEFIGEIVIWPTASRIVLVQESWAESESWVRF